MAALGELVNALKTDPILLARLRDIERRGSAPRVTPRSLRGEQLMYALCVASSSRFAPVGDPATTLLNELGSEPSRLTFSRWIRDAVPYLWRRDLMLLAKSMPLPRHVLGSDLFPQDCMYWTLDSSVRLLNPGPRFSGVLIDAWLVVRRNSDYVVAQLGEATHDTDGQMSVCAVQVVPFGSRYPGELAGGVIDDLLHMAAFLASPFVKTDPQRAHLANKVRRRYGSRVGDPVAVNVVSLRAEVREAVAVERGEGPQWKQRWLVRGHYRAQWYPSTSSHKVIWVAPYLKGPDGAPLRPQTYAVVR